MGKSDVLEHKSSNISETRKDSGKVTVEGRNRSQLAIYIEAQLAQRDSVSTRPTCNSRLVVLAKTTVHYAHYFLCNYL